MWLRWRIWKQCQKDEQQKAGLLFRESSNDEKEIESVRGSCYSEFYSGLKPPVRAVCFFLIRVLSVFKNILTIPLKYLIVLL